MRIRTAIKSVAAAAAATVLLAACVAGEGSANPSSGDGEWSTDTLNIDYATYNPLSLIIKEKGWLEDHFGDDVTVNWEFSAGSNRANELLRAGEIDFGSTAGSAALLAKANGSPIKAFLLYTQPEWAAIVVPADSDVTELADLRGRTIAATRGTDPYFFLLQALEEAGIGLDEVEIEQLQHADGRVALETGAVEVWSGLDPLMAASEAEAGSTLIYRNIGFNTYGFLNAREAFLEESPDIAQVVADVYEKARAYALANLDEVIEILADEAGIDEQVARLVIEERTVIDLPPAPGETQHAVLAVVGPIFVESGDVANQDLIDTALDELFDTTWIDQADASRIAGD